MNRPSNINDFYDADDFDDFDDSDNFNEQYDSDDDDDFNTRDYLDDDDDDERNDPDYHERPRLRDDHINYNQITSATFSATAHSENSSPEHCYDAAYEAAFNAAISCVVYKGKYWHPRSHDRNSPVVALAREAVYKHACEVLRVDRAERIAQYAYKKVRALEVDSLAALIDGERPYQDDYDSDDFTDYCLPESDEVIDAGEHTIRSFDEYDPYFGFFKKMDEIATPLYEYFDENSFDVIDEFFIEDIEYEDTRYPWGSTASRFQTELWRLGDAGRVARRSAADALKKLQEAEKEAEYALSEAVKDREYLERIAGRQDKKDEIARATAALERGERYAAKLTERVREAREAYRLAQIEAQAEIEAEASLNAKKLPLLRQIRRAERDDIKQQYYAPGAENWARLIYHVALSVAHRYPEAELDVLLRACDSGFYNSEDWHFFWAGDFVSHASEYNAIREVWFAGQNLSLRHKQFTSAFDEYDPFDEIDLAISHKGYLLSGGWIDSDARDEPQVYNSDNDWDYYSWTEETMPYHAQIDIAATAEKAQENLEELESTAQRIADATVKRAIIRGLHQD